MSSRYALSPHHLSIKLYSIVYSKLRQTNRKILNVPVNKVCEYSVANVVTNLFQLAEPFGRVPQTFFFIISKDLYFIRLIKTSFVY